MFARHLATAPRVLRARRYGANLANYQFLEQLNAEFPALSLLATEATLEAPGSQFIGSTPWKEAQKYAVDMIADLNQWTTGWIEWNVLLDSSGGPTCIGPSLTTFCTPLIGACTSHTQSHFALAIPESGYLLFSLIDWCFFDCIMHSSCSR